MCEHANISLSCVQHREVYIKTLTYVYVKNALITFEMWTGHIPLNMVRSFFTPSTKRKLIFKLEQSLRIGENGSWKFKNSISLTKILLTTTIYHFCSIWNRTRFWPEKGIRLHCANTSCSNIFKCLFLLNAEKPQHPACLSLPTNIQMIRLRLQTRSQMFSHFWRVQSSDPRPNKLVTTLWTSL